MTCTWPNVDMLRLDEWCYGSWFDAPIATGLPSVRPAAERLAADAELEKHPFFICALADPRAVLCWLTQELIITNAFSQLVLAAAAVLPNVHHRSILAEVASGEHGKFRDGAARAAHPSLLERLRTSIGIERSDVKPLAPTVHFLSRLASRIPDPIASVAFIGVGNERLIEPEYTAVEKCFDRHFPDASYRPFLHANVNEDILHSNLCYDLADALIETEADRDRYISEARLAIASRVQYFDELLKLTVEQGSNWSTHPS